MSVYLRVRNQLSLPVGHRLIGKRPNDRFLASYPRSGSTWLRTMLVNILIPNANSNPDIFNAVIPGVSISQAPRIRRLRSPRLIHTHTYYRPDIDRVVYTIRDGRDVLVSFYHYLVTRLGKPTPFNEWFERYLARDYGHRWDENVRSWLVDGGRALGDAMLVVHFEEMKSQPVNTLQSVCQHLGINVLPEVVENAVAEANLENARRIEQSRAKENTTGDASFYRGGKSGQWAQHFTPEIEKRFWELSQDCMNYAGYSR